jgi:hypothetical protein
MATKPKEVVFKPVDFEKEIKDLESIKAKQKNALIISHLDKRIQELIKLRGQGKAPKKETLKEDLMTPVFLGDSMSVNTALQTWTSLFGFFSSIEQNNISKENSLAIYTALQDMIASRVNLLANPAQASMAAVAGPQAVPTQAMAAVPPPAPVPAAPVTSVALPQANAASPEACAYEFEEEPEEEEEKEPENKDEQEDAGESPTEPTSTNPATEVDQPVVVKTDDEDSEEDKETDPDKKSKKKEVVDLTTEAIDPEFKKLFAGLESDLKKFLSTDDLSDRLYDRAFGYYLSKGKMPYGTAKARTGDPYLWVANALRNDMKGIKEDKYLNKNRMLELAGLKVKM